MEKNPLKALHSDVFKPLEGSNVIFLNLRSSQLEFIDKGKHSTLNNSFLFSTLVISDTFAPLKKLESIDLYFNPKLFQPGAGTGLPPISLAFDVLEQWTAMENIGGKYLNDNTFNPTLTP